MIQPVKHRPVDRKPWAPNHFVTDTGTPLPTLGESRIASALTTLALLKINPKVPRDAR